jgi:16S rRNA C967 or C1407 C5-methylase (RsmB/RsmF family)
MNISEEAQKQLTELQLKLLTAGFTNLKSGGILVYSTCSLSSQQNEDIVNSFLQREPNCKLMPLNFDEDSPAIKSTLQHALRF